MTTRLQRLQLRAASAANTRKEKVARLHRFHTFCFSFIVQALAFHANNPDYNEEHVLPRTYDIELTAREVARQFGHQCADIFQHIFIRWTTKWKDRPTTWKVNIAVAPVYGKWISENLDATPAEALAFVKGVGGGERLRRVAKYTHEGRNKKDIVLLSKDEHKMLLLEEQRQLRKAWSSYVFRAEKAREEALR